MIKTEHFFSYKPADLKLITAEEVKRAAEFEYKPPVAREFFHALGIYRDPMKAMG